MHETIGQIGHLAVIISFVTSLISGVSFFLAAINPSSEEKISWNKFGTYFFHIHSVAVWSFVVLLFVIIYNHYYEYHYAWSHSSNFLPTHFMISCFWEGQEGSFMLWIFWNVLLGQILVWKKNRWTPEVMTIFMSVQFFLTSMILGVVFFNTYKLGSSPFILLRDVLTDAPIFQKDPNWVPEDGTGLNPLLQNYWMVIHPPTLFLGFALALVPFAYCIAGLWKNDFSSWIKPALTWTLVAAMVLGAGIMMGGYWAYETLNFGGYWNWDPVENAVYVPWLTLIVAIHMMLIYKKNGTALKTVIVFIIVSFILVLYSTFLTRSGVLGNASVHSFTDLGLSGQLLIYLFFYLILSVFLLIKKWKNIPDNKPENTNSFTPDFWLFIGAIVLGLAAFQVIFATSIPVINKIADLIGLNGNWAPPSDQVSYYGSIQIWAAIAVSFIAGIAQYIWWHGTAKVSQPASIRKFYLILGVLFTLSTLIIVFYNASYGITNEVFSKFNTTNEISVLLKFAFKILSFTLLLTFSLLLLVTSTGIFIKVWKTQVRFTGGSIAHFGLALLLIGVLFSSAYDKILSENKTGLLISKELPDDINLENILLSRNGSKMMGDYQVTYTGSRKEIRGASGYYDSQHLNPIEEGHYALVKTELTHKGKVLFQKGDTVEISPENTFYEVNYLHKNGEKFSLYPRSQVNPSMGFLASPDLQHTLFYDLYTHVSTVFNPEKRTWRDTTLHQMKLGDTIFVNDYVTILDSVRGADYVAGVKMDSENAIAVTAYFRVMSREKEFEIRPSIIILNKNQMAHLPDESEDVGIKMSFLSVDPETETFTFASNTSQLDFIVLKVVKKPMINLLWLGTILILVGFTVSIRRRYVESKQS